MQKPEIEWNWKEASYVPEWHESIVTLLSRYVKRQSKVLEIGAGGSHTIGALATRLNCDVVGIEPDIEGLKKTLEFAREQSGKVEMIQGDGFHLPFGKESFDVVYSLGLIEHFKTPDYKRLIQEHFRVVKSDGIVIIAVPNLLNFPHTIRKYLLKSKYQYHPERSFTPRQLQRLIGECGFNIITLDGVLPLWSVAMLKHGWMITAGLDRMGIGKRLKELKSARLRALTGYMCYIVARK